MCVCVCVCGVCVSVCVRERVLRIVVERDEGSCSPGPHWKTRERAQPRTCITTMSIVVTGSRRISPLSIEIP